MKSTLPARGLIRNGRTRACRLTGAGSRNLACVVKATSAKQTTPPKLQSLPKSYDQLIRQAQASVKSALADGVGLMEVEFPTSGLTSASGDGEGKVEMDDSLKYLRQFLNAFSAEAANTRIFFPEKKELKVAKYGTVLDPNAGSVAGAASFGQNSGFALDYLTVPNAFWDLGLDVGKLDMAARVRATDKLLFAAYPYFNVQEMVAVYEMWDKAARDRKVPLVIFNGELDRIRTGYYSPWLVPRIGPVLKHLIPQVEGAYYLRNIKRPAGTLFRAYPGPWQVIRRDVYNETERVIHTSETRPDIRKVALEILPDPKL